MRLKSRYDAIIIGAGHNGLVAAAYLAKHGLSVIVFERADRYGGACITDEIMPGFKVSGAAQFLGMLRPEIIADLELQRHGLKVQLRDPEIFVPFPDGKHLFFYNDTARTIASIAKLSAKDAKAFAAFDHYNTRVAEILGATMLQPAPSLATFAEMFEPLSEGQEILQTVLFGSVADYLDRWFESDYVKGPLTYGAMSGSACGPRTPGTAFSKFYHSATRLEGIAGAWATVRGGMGSITDALATAAKTYGATIQVDAEVSEIICREGRAAGILLADGREVYAQYVLSNADPKRTFLKLLPADALEAELRDRVSRIKMWGTGFKINFALSELPNFRALPGSTLGPQHMGGIMIAPSVDYFERAWDEAKWGKPASRPFSQFSIQSAADPSLAPEGRQTLSLWGHHVPKAMAAAEVEVERENVAERMTDLLTEYAPNFRASVLARQVYLPADIEARYGITGGQIFHGDLMPDQVMWGRPLTGFSGHDAPIKGLFLCGAGTHPGGDVCGAPGYNAAHAVIGKLSPKQSVRAAAP
jgi:phytoene dehydrogenase-like protein